jgi:hypothetical protein
MRRRKEAAAGMAASSHAIELTSIIKLRVPPRTIEVYHNGRQSRRGAGGCAISFGTSIKLRCAPSKAVQSAVRTISDTGTAMETGATTVLKHMIFSFSQI